MTAHEIQRDIFRRMTPAQRWAVARRLDWSVRRLKAAHIRSLHPAWSEDEVQRAVREAFMHVHG